MILFRLADAPVNYDHLVRWVRLQWPRILPDAIGAQLCELQRVGLIECAQRKWRVRCSW